MLFFFFQAEDGIRDLTVTGVQTCALPICMARRGRLRWYQIVWGPNKMTWDRGGLKPGMLPGLLGYRLRLAQPAGFPDFAHCVSHLSPGRTRVLLLIEAKPGLTPRRLAPAGRPGRSTIGGAGD